MGKFASYDASAEAPYPVNGWYDTDAIDYPSLPEALVAMTEAQWDARMTGQWAYDGTSLVPILPPPPTLAQQAQLMLINPVTVQSTAVPELDGDYANNESVRGQITSIASSINAGLGLPGGGSTFNWPSADGTMRMWPAPQFTGYAQAMMNFVYACAQVMQGHSDTLPSTTLTIP